MGHRVGGCIEGRHHDRAPHVKVLLHRWAAGEIALWVQLVGLEAGESVEDLQWELPSGMHQA